MTKINGRSKRNEEIWRIGCHGPLSARYYQQVENRSVVGEVVAWRKILRSFVVIERTSEYEPIRMSLKSTAFDWLWLIFARMKRLYDVSGESAEKKTVETGEREI